MKTYEVIFRHGVLVTVPDNATKEEIIESAVETFNSNDLDDMYMTEEDVQEVFLFEESVEE